MPMREILWTGIIEWTEKTNNDQPKVTRHALPCYVTPSLKDDGLDIKADNWPSRLIMQLMPKQLLSQIGGHYLKDAKIVVFHPNAYCDTLETLTKVLSSGFAGCVHFNMPPDPFEIKILIILFTNENKAFLGFIPNNQIGFIDQLREVIVQNLTSRLVQGPQQQPGLQSIQQQGAGNRSNTSQAQTSQQTLGNPDHMCGPSPPQIQQRFEFNQHKQTTIEKMHLKQSLELGYVQVKKKITWPLTRGFISGCLFSFFVFVFICRYLL